MDRWRQAAQDAIAHLLLTIPAWRNFEKCIQAYRREIKRLQNKLHHTEKALTLVLALLVASCKIQAFWCQGRVELSTAADRRKALEIL